MFLKMVIIWVALFLVGSASAGPSTKFADGITLNSITTLGTNGDLTINPAGTGSVLLPDLTADRVLYLDGSKKIKSSSTSLATLGYLDIASSLTTLLAAKAPTASPTFSGVVNIGTTIAGLVRASGAGALSISSSIAVNEGGTGNVGIGTSAGGVVYFDGTKMMNSGPGTSGYVLQSNGTSSPSWTAIAVSTSVISKTSAYTLTPSDNVVLASGSGFTLTLYAASGNAGKIIYIKKTDSSFSNIITIDANSSETIDGALTTTLNTLNEQVALICDGSGWQILSRNIPGTWTSYTPTFVGFGTVSNVDFRWRRDGPVIQVIGFATAGTVTATPGTLSLPSGLIVDTSLGANAKLVGRWTTNSIVASNYKDFNIIAGGSSGGVLYVSTVEYAATLAPLTAQNVNAIMASNLGMAFNIEVPVDGWK